MESTTQWLANQCAANLLNEKWLLAEEMRIAQQWKDRINLLGWSTINLHSKTLSTITLSLVSNQLAEKKFVFAGQATARMLVRNVFCELQHAQKLNYFHNVQSIEGLCDLMARSIRDMRLARISPESVSVNAFESPAKAEDVRQIYRAYVDLLEDQRVVDYSACIKLATDGLDSGSIQLPPDLLILLPELPTISRAEQHLLDVLASKSTLQHSKELDAYAVASGKLADLIGGGHASFEYLSGIGEVNEVRGVFQRILSEEDDGPRRFDETEILHTDYAGYVPLILEQVTGWLADQQVDAPIEIDKLPVTFAEGIACIYSRPGRALRGWLRWAHHEFIQTRVVQLVREGLLDRPEDARSIGYSRLANTLRQVPIGFQANRYLPKIQESIQSALESLQEYEQKVDAETDESEPETTRRDFGLSALRAVSAMVEPLVRLAPAASDDATTVLGKARSFLLQCARADNKLDRYARDKLLDDINGMLRTIELGPDADLDVTQWLEELPIDSRILASGPQPGCVHVAPLSRGGHSGRKNIFVVGLDDGRYPKRVAIDPVLLDAERERLSADLLTANEVADDIQQSLDRALYRALIETGKRVCLSYSVRNLVEDRDSFPSASMLELFRVTESNDDAHLDDLLANIGPPVAFVSPRRDDHLSAADGQLARFLEEGNPKQRQQWLEEAYSHTRRQRVASESYANAQLTEFDGLVQAAGVDLDPGAAERVSPSRLETYGTCPRRFFFSRGLGIYPPDEWTVDRERWLDPLQYGNFLHALFETFLGTLTTKELTPSVGRDSVPLRDLLYEQLDGLKSTIPIPNEDAYRRTCDGLEETCEVFLAKEEEYCRLNNARPWVLEAAIGLNNAPKTELDCREPISLTLSDGRVIRVGGRLDRVDKLMTAGSERYAIWDYKSGSGYGFDQERPFSQGRKLQAYLYVGMLRHRIAAMGGSRDAVASFGYFFPNPRTDGLRLQWTQAELRSGDEVLRHICDLISSGVFLPTTDAQDCRFCDYLPVCGDAEVVTKQSLWKSTQDCNQVLQPWRVLRELEGETP